VGLEFGLQSTALNVFSVDGDDGLRRNRLGFEIFFVVNANGLLMEGVAEPV
jgi:hypothetical protein